MGDLYKAKLGVDKVFSAIPDEMQENWLKITGFELSEKEKGCFLEWVKNRFMTYFLLELERSVDSRKKKLTNNNSKQQLKKIEKAASELEKLLGEYAETEEVMAQEYVSSVKRRAQMEKAKENGDFSEELQSFYDLRTKDIGFTGFSNDVLFILPPQDTNLDKIYELPIDAGLNNKAVDDWLSHLRSIPIIKSLSRRLASQDTLVNDGFVNLANKNDRITDLLSILIADWKVVTGSFPWEETVGMGANASIMLFIDQVFDDLKKIDRTISNDGFVTDMVARLDTHSNGKPKKANRRERLRVIARDNCKKVLEGWSESYFDQYVAEMSQISPVELIIRRRRKEHNHSQEN